MSCIQSPDDFDLGSILDPGAWEEAPRVATAHLLWDGSVDEV